jgi:hypothetical protein
MQALRARMRPSAVAGQASMMEVRARILEVHDDGLVTQMLHSNAVIKCLWAKKSKPVQHVKQEQIRKREQIFEREQTVKLRVLACEPPDIVVEVASVEETPTASASAAQPLPADTVHCPRRRVFLAGL